MEEAILQTRIKELTYQLESALQDLEALQHAVSHDLRAPLRAIGGFCAILKEDYQHKLDEEADRLVETVVSSAAEMNHMIDDILRTSRVGRMQLAEQPVAMRELAEQCIAELILPEEREAITLATGDLAPCSGDAVMLKEVWMQLLKNALQHAAKNENPAIEIAYQNEEAMHVYAIKHSKAGVGLAPGNKLLRLLQRLHGNNGFEGADTGIALVKRIVLKHKGSLWTEALDNGGTAFYFGIPKQEKQSV